MIILDQLAACASIRHGFMTRIGGVSEGLYASLNCGLGSGDNQDHVAENRARSTALLGLPPNALVTMHQIHSPVAVVVEQPWQAQSAQLAAQLADPQATPQADGLVTRTPGIALGVLSADCVPVLFADPEAGVIGAAHAGWRGALHGVLEATLQAMIGLGATRAAIRAGIGPAIQQRSYEVGTEFMARFAQEDPAHSRFFIPAAKPEHLLFDLPKFVEHRLHGAGLTQITRSLHDTLSDEDQFFSYRRATLRGEAVYGRGISMIALV